MENKFWTMNKDHNIGLCSLIVGLMGPLDFSLLRHCATQTGSKVQKPDSANSSNSSNQHSKNSNTDTILSDKLAGITDPEEISKISHSMQT